MEKTACRTPAEGRDGVTNIPSWKFDAVQVAILDALSDADIPFAELQDAVKARLAPEVLEKLGSLGWHTTVVKLEMEVRGEVERVEGTSPQLLRKVIT